MQQAPLQTALFQVIIDTCLTVDDLMAAVGQTRTRVTRALSGLVVRGLAERREKGCYAATAAGLEHFAKHGHIVRGTHKLKDIRVRVRGSLRQRAWNVMRIKSPFTIREVAALATVERKDAERSLYVWFRALEIAGFIRREPRRETSDLNGSNGWLRYRLMKNTGMAAPVHSAAKGVIHDPNTGKDTPCQK